MARDARRMRGDGPTVFAQVKNEVGVDEIVRHVAGTWTKATAPTSR
jgi:urease accessory protein